MAILVMLGHGGLLNTEYLKMVYANITSLKVFDTDYYRLTLANPGPKKNPVIAITQCLIYGGIKNPSDEIS